MIARLTLLLLALVLPAQAKIETFYLGTYTAGTSSQGIYAGTLDTDTGKLGPLHLAAAATPDPTVLALSPDQHVLFAALGNAVASFAIAPDNSLGVINRQPSSGPNTCYVSLDKTGRQLFSASYDGGSIASFPVDARGSIGLPTAIVPLTGFGPNHMRQASPHPHSAYVDPEDKHLYVPDLGADKVWTFNLGPHGTLTAADPPAIKTESGSGPRHLAFSPDGTQVYVVNEMGVSTCVYARDPATGALTLLKSYPNLPGDSPHHTGSAELAIDSSGQHLYVSTRSRDFFTVFRINPGADDPLTVEQVVASPVAFPRSFAIDPSGQWLVVAGETDDRIGLMKIDPATGHLSATPETQPLGRPVCVLFAPY
jgi:6-phosphogluconolactonase